MKSQRCLKLIGKGKFCRLAYNCEAVPCVSELRPDFFNSKRVKR